MYYRRKSFLTAGLITSLLLIGIAYAGCCDKSTDKCKDKESSCPKAPQFTLTNFDGEQISLADFEGRIVVLEWLNYDCPFIKYHHQTVSTMADLAEKYADKNVTWVGINSTHYATIEGNKEFAKNSPVPSVILDDHEGKVGHAYKAARTPEIFIIDPQGNIAYQGAVDNAPFGKLSEGETEKINYVDKALAEMTAGEDVGVPKTAPYGCTVKYAD